MDVGVSYSQENTQIVDCHISTYYSLGIQKIEGSKTPNVIHQTRREGHTGLNHTIISKLALDDEETKKFNWLETEQKSHSDTGL